MCGNNRRAARHEGYYGRRAHREPTTGGIGSIIGAIQELKLAAHGIDSRAQAHYGTMPQAYAAGLDTQSRGVERGVVHDDSFPSAADEKKQLPKETIDFEELPSYEASTGARSKPSSPPTAGETIYTPATSEASYDRRGRSQSEEPLPRGNPRADLLSNLELLRSSLLTYSQGVRGGKRDVKHAARDFFNDLRAQEFERARGEGGHIGGGERKQLRRELKPVKEMLKGAVREAKQERRSRH